MPSTVRHELTKLGFDWKEGTIIAEPRVGHRSNLAKARVIDAKDTLLDEVWYHSPISSGIPRIIAIDKHCIYFADRHPRDDATYVRRLPYKPSAYLRDGHAERIPHPDDR